MKTYERDLDYIYRKLDELEGSVEKLKTLEHAMAQNHGWIGGAWQRDPLRPGYSGDWTEQVTNLNASAGTNTLTGAAVPAGEFWRVQAASALNNTSNPTQVQIYVVVNGVPVVLLDQASPGAGRYVTWSGEITLSAGDKVESVFKGCLAGDDIFLMYHAVRVDIDQ